MNKKYFFIILVLIFSLITIQSTYPQIKSSINEPSILTENILSQSSQSIYVEGLREELSLNSRWVILTFIGLLLLIIISVYLWRKELFKLFFRRLDNNKLIPNKNTFFIWIAFFFLTIIITYPLIFRAYNSLTNLLDPLLNTYVLWWNWDSLLNAWGNYYNPPIFYPNINTIAYTENLFFIGLYTAPIYLITQNSIFAYNSAVFLNYFLSGIAMFYLIYHLIKRVDIAFISSAFFAFTSYHFSKRSHLHISSYQWMPFILLFLHRYAQKPQFKLILTVTLFALFQSLSSLYLGIFSIFLVSLFLLYQFIISREFRKRKTVLQIILCAIIFIIIFYPIISPYLYHQKLGFTRSLSEAKRFSADIYSYLGTFRSNLIWGSIAYKYGNFARAEAEGFFPGIVIVMLSIFGVLSFFKKISIQSSIHNLSSKTFLISEIIDIFITLQIIIIILIILFNGIQLKIWGVEVTIRRLKNPFLILTLTLFLKIIIDLWLVKNKKIKFWDSTSNERIFYLLLTIIAVFLTLGPIIHLNGKEIGYGPYFLFYKYIPGIAGMRVPGRFYVLVLIGICVMAAYGLQRILQHLQKFSQPWLCIIFLAIILMENYNGPLPATKTNTNIKSSYPSPILNIKREDIPPVYNWLSTMPDDINILELPYNNFNLNVQYQYYSRYHNKRLINGYSGYVPSSYYYIEHLLRNFPDEESLNFLKDINVNLIIFHSTFYNPEDAKKIETLLLADIKSLKELANFSGTRVFQILQSQKDTNRDTNNFLKEKPKGKPMDLQQCKFECSGASKEFNKLYDNNRETLYRIGTQNKNQFLQIELPETKKISDIIMEHWLSPQNSPAGIIIYTFIDSKNWQSVWEQKSLSITLRHLLSQSGNFKWTFSFNPIDAKYIKIEQIGEKPHSEWAIAELTFFGSNPSQN